MATPFPPPERDLLFGLIALQMGLVGDGPLLDAIQDWAGSRAAPLSQVLEDRGALDESSRRAVEAEVKDRLAKPPSHAPSGVTTVFDWHVTTAPGAGPSVSPGPVSSAPRYRKVRMHRRGGVGEVSVAVDQELGREVALKEIQSPYADQAEARRRFVREAMLTGGLEHPGIVPVYGLGHNPDGRPYYAMRLIRGESLEEAIRRFHAGGQGAPDGPGQGEIQLRSLLARFIAVCHAVAYAHSRGVIHRDLKPANVMLGDYGETLVVDWGLARRFDESAEERPSDRPAATAAPDRTQDGRAVGTPGFMAPEQARGDWGRVGARSDIFGLGATLYALLTGKAPHEGRDALTRAAAGVVTPARQVNRAVPAPLEAVCARAMAPAPEGRYGSARDLAADVERWLADETVQAYREPARVRARRWARRNQATVTAGVVLLLASVAGLAVGLVAVRTEQGKTAEALVKANAAEQEARDNWGRAELNLDRARKAERQAKTNLSVAEANLALARKAVDDCFGIAKSHHLLQAPSLRKVRNLLLEQSLGLYKNFRTPSPGGPAVTREVADHLVRIGYIHEELGDLNEADRQYQAAVAALRQSLTDRPDAPGPLRELTWALIWQSYNSRRLKALGPALRSSAEAVAVGRRLVSLQPGEAENRHALANALSTLGSIQNYRGRHRDARSNFAEAADLLRPLVTDRPAILKYQANLSMILQQLSEVETDLDDREKAERLAIEAVEGDRRLVRALPESHTFQLHLTYRLIALGMQLNRHGKPEQALRGYNEAVDLLRRLARTQPDVPLYQVRLAKVLDLRAGVHLGRGKATSALEDVTRAFELLAELEGRGFEPMEVTIRLHTAHLTRAQVFLALGRPHETLAECDRAAAASPHGVSAVVAVIRAGALAQLGKSDQIAAEAADLAQGYLEPAAMYHLARMWALSAAGASGAHPPLPLAEKAEARAAQAVASLARASRAGYFAAPANIDRLDRNPDLAILRNRGDYKQFRSSLAPRKSPGP